MYDDIIDEIREKAEILMRKNQMDYLDFVIAMPNFIITELKYKLNKGLHIDVQDKSLSLFGIRLVPHFENKIVIFYKDICTSKNKENEKIEIEL